MANPAVDLSKHEKPPKPLTPADVIVGLVDRYMVLLQETVERVHPEFEEAAIRSAFARLMATGVLQSKPFFDKRVYYHFTKTEARRRGHGNEWGTKESFGRKTCIQRFGVLWYCLHCAQRRLLLTRDEFKQVWPRPFAEGFDVKPSTNYFQAYAEDRGQDQYGRLRIDHGGQHIARIVSATEQQLRYLKRSSALAEGIDPANGAFCFAIASGDQKRLDDLKEAVEAKRIRATFVFELIPQLKDLWSS